MLHSLFGSSTIQGDTKQLIFRHAINSNTSGVVGALTNANINPSDSHMIDEFGQNLLHIAVKKRNYELACYLVDSQTSITRSSIFDETPLDIAIKNHDKKMIETLYRKPLLDFHKNENTRLIEKITNLENNNKTLITTNKELTIKNSTLHVQLDKEINSKKRKFEEYETCFTENKRLKTDNSKLLCDNMALQTTVTSLRDSMKKK